MPQFTLRHLITTEPEKKNEKKIELGSKTSGITISIITNGIKINGYYTSSDNKTQIYSNLRESLIITWEDLEKFKKQPTSSRNNKVGYEKFISKEDLEQLPKVHLNSKLYFVDIINNEIRPYDRPQTVYNLGKHD